MDYGTCHIGPGGSVILVVHKYFGFFFIEVLAGVGGFIFQNFDKAVKTSCENRTKGRAQPVNPVIWRKVVENNARTERAGGV